MLLPYHENAYVPSEKLVGYLLSESHAVGKSKAKFFRMHGYHHDNIHLLKQGLLQIARQEAVREEAASPHGTKYVIPGTLKTPRGTFIRVRTIWILEPGTEQPRFITAYPT